MSKQDGQRTAEISMTKVYYIYPISQTVALLEHVWLKYPLAILAGGRLVREQSFQRIELWLCSGILMSTEFRLRK